MAYDSNMLLQVQSSRLGARYEAYRFTEYRVDIDLETDSDGFDFVFKNPDGAYTGLFSKFDDIEIILNDKPIMRGHVDSVKYKWDSADSLIHINGRDLAHILVDNDAIPGTKLNVKPSSYISTVCGEYGIKHSLDGSIAAVSKLIIGTGESEISIINNILMDSRKRLWYFYDTLHCGNWATNAEPTHYFSRGVPSDQQGIPIESFELSEDGSDTKSEVRIYGSVNDGTEKIVGVAKNDIMIDKGIKRRSTKRSSNNDASSKYASNALEDIRDSFKDNIELQITIKTGKDLILPNTTAQVIDTITKTNGIFFIKSVSYTKSISSGSTTIIKMIPGDTTFNVIWGSTSQSVVGTSKMSVAELIGTKKKMSVAELIASKK